MSDTTTARRALLMLLLDRVERGALLGAEQPLLRALVAAEQDAADNPPWPADAPVPARRVFYRGTDGEDMHAEYMRLLAAAARVRALFTSKRPDLLPDGSDAEWNGYRCAMADVKGALDGPAPIPDDTPTTADDTPTREDGRPTCRRMPARTCPDSYDGQPCDPRPCARFESDDPTPWAPAGTPAAVIEALRTGQPVTLTRCSPLVNPACPGHTDAVRCDRAPSHPVTVAAAPDWAALNGFTDWATSADDQCPARYTGESPHLTEGPWQPVDYRCGRRRHGPDSDHAVRQPDQGSVFCWTDAIAVYPVATARCTATIPDHSLASLGVIFQCELDAGHYDPADEPVFNDPPTTGGWHKSGDLNWSDQAEGATPHTDAPQDPA